MSSIKVLHVITGLSTGGAERMLVRLLEASDSQRYEHVVISLIEGGGQRAAVEALGVPVHTVGMRPGKPTLGALLRVRRLVREAGPDVIHGWMYHGALAGLLAHADRPTIIAIHHALHDLRAEKRGTRLVIRVLGRLARRADRVVYCSSVSRRQHEQHGYPLARGHVIPNGFDCTQLRPERALRASVRAHLGVAEQEFVIGNFGRWHPLKDHATLLKAVAEIVQRHSHVRLLLCGHGITQDNLALRALIDRFGLAERVTLLGERGDVPALLNALDLYVSSSSSEAFPMVLGEAMAVGIPCVTTDAGDSAEIVGRSGQVVAAGDAAALAAACEEMVMLPVTNRAELGLLAREQVLARYNLPAVVQAYSALYDELAATPERVAAPVNPPQRSDNSGRST